MKPIEFPEQTCVLAENQPPYLPLPVYKEEDGMVVSCWKCSLWERIKVLLSGKVWVYAWTFNQPLQPQSVVIDRPFVKVKAE